MFRYQQWIELLKLRHFEKFLLFIIGNYYMFFQKKVQFCANLFNDFLFISKQLLKHFRNNLLFKYNLCPIFGPTYIFVPFRLYHYQKCLSVINNFHWKAKRTILRRTFLYVNGMDFNMCGVIEEIKIHHLLKSGRLQRKIKQPIQCALLWKLSNIASIFQNAIYKSGIIKRPHSWFHIYFVISIFYIQISLQNPVISGFDNRIQIPITLT